MNERIFAIAHYADMAVLYLLMLLALVAVVVIVERYLVLNKLVRENKAILRQIESKMISAPDQAFYQALAASENTLVGKVARQLQSHFQLRGEQGLEAFHASLIQLQRPRLEKSLPFLATVGSNAPYIGLFGTVLGIMKAFQDMAAAGSAGNQAVMAGISAALIATAAGLLVAIPAVLAYNYFQKQVKGIIGQLDLLKDLLLAQGLEKKG